MSSLLWGGRKHQACREVAANLPCHGGAENAALHVPSVGFPKPCVEQDSIFSGGVMDERYRKPRNQS